MNLIEAHNKDIRDICENHKVDTLYLFGSFAKNQEKPESDVDLLVNFGEVDLYDYFDNFYDFLKRMEKLLGRKIDLVSEKYISNPYLKRQINSSRVLLYDRQHPGLAA
jgi:predicted nucleotidyltransferase